MKWLRQMQENYALLDGNEQKRAVIFTLITVLAAIMTAGFVSMFYDIATELPIQTEETDFYVDSDNFGPLLVPVFNGAVGIAVIAAVAVSALYAYGLHLLAYGLFRIFAFRNVTAASAFEYQFAKQVLTALLIADSIVSLLTAHFQLLLQIAVMIFPTGLFGYLFYILPLRRRIQTNGDDIR